MFSSKANYLMLRTNLRLCINRFKLLEKKKTELALKARREISEYIAAGKEDRARIRVEHIIREDYLVEAMEIIEMLCDLLLARFGLIEKMSELDPGLEEAISTILWVAPRLSADVQELREVSRQLTIKYGKEYVEMCRRNGFETVNEKVIQKLSPAAPPKILVENYMIEIARTYKVSFEPDPLVMKDQPVETADLIELGTDDRRSGGKGGKGGGDGGGQGITSPRAGFSKQQEAGLVNSLIPPAYGTGMPPSDVGGNGGYSVVSSSGFSFMPNGLPQVNQPGQPGSAGVGTATGLEVGGNVNYFTTPGASIGNAARMPVVSGGVDGTAGGANATIGNTGGTYVADVNMESMPGASVTGAGFGIPECHNPLAGGVPLLPDEQGNFPDAVQPGAYASIGPQSPSSNPAGISPSLLPPPLPVQRPNAGSPAVSLSAAPPYFLSPDTVSNEPHLPPYDEVIRSSSQYHTVPRSNSPLPGPSTNAGQTLPDFPVLPDPPNLPNIPSNSVGRTSVTSEDVDFDDLTRRFEELKKRK